VSLITTLITHCSAPNHAHDASDAFTRLCESRDDVDKFTSSVWRRFFFQHSGSQREFEMFRVTMPVVLPLPSIDPPAWGFRTLACPQHHLLLATAAQLVHFPLLVLNWSSALLLVQLRAAANGRPWSTMFHLSKNSHAAIWYRLLSPKLTIGFFFLSEGDVRVARAQGVSSTTLKWA